ncbi:MAG: RND family efflux transporter MFP subunit [Candidatus Azotimanducaceae bacterium]|jgi:RND family efflux transporter MFP subunit
MKLLVHCPTIAQIFVLILVLVLGVSGCSDRQPPSIDDQMVRQAKLMTVETVSPFQELEFVGRVEAAQTVDMSFQVPGPLAQMSLLEGQTLKRGELVAALETTEFDLAVKEAEAQLKLALLDLQRKRWVLADKGIAKSAVEDAETIAQLQQVKLDIAREALADSTIEAPFDAYVAKRYFYNFTNVKAMEPIVRLQNRNELLMVTSLPESVIATTTSNQLTDVSAEFSFIDDKKFPLSFRENRSEPETLSQTYKVTFSFANSQEFNILPGMTAKVTIRLHNLTDQAPIAYVPTASIVSSSDNKLAVWLVDEQSGRVTLKVVGTGIPDGNKVAVTSGLNTGDKIVIAGASQLREGMIVIPFQSGSGRLD